MAELGVTTVPGNQPVGIYEHPRAQRTVDFPIGGHVNILLDYKETVPEKYQHSQCNRVIDMLITCCHNHIPLALLKCRHVCGPSVLTSFSMFFCVCIVTKKGKIHYALPNTRHYTAHTS